MPAKPAQFNLQTTAPENLSDAEAAAELARLAAEIARHESDSESGCMLRKLETEMEPD